MSDFIAHPTSSLISQFRYHMACITTIPLHDWELFLNNYQSAKDIIGELSNRGETHLIQESRSLKRYLTLTGFIQNLP